MKITVAKNSGFCFGVRRAIEQAVGFSRQHGDVYTIGPIIHNPQVVEELDKKGIRVADEIKDIGCKNVVIRAHGIPRKTLAILEKKKFRILDATCPYVTRAKEHAERLASEGYKVVIIGNPEHPEIKYISSYLPAGSIILRSAEDVAGMKYYPKLGVITQTTQSQENFVRIASLLINYSGEFKIFNTICPDATKRQQEAETLAARNDVMIIIGGKNSANTVRLAAISKKIRPRTYHIETSDELKMERFRNVSKVGIVTGASTPEWIINEVVEWLKNVE
jgi:4-hydroxy-3-methylbut-2-enyl diphosphate reductase